MIGELAAFAQALTIAFANTLGGKSTQLSSWRKTLRASSLISFLLILILIVINFNNFSLISMAIGILAGISGGLGLPLAYQAFSLGPVSFAAPVIAVMQSVNLIAFAVIAKNESLGVTFPIALLLAVIGLYLCSKKTEGNKPITFKVFYISWAAAIFFSGFSILMTNIDKQEILFALFGVRIGVLLVSLVFHPATEKIPTAGATAGLWKKYALISGVCEITANILFMVAINNLELSKVGIFMAASPMLSTLIAIKLLKQKPSVINWLGIFASCSALLIIALN
jgi:drug/metabolite transporter (DMT)-like permease